MTPALMQHIPLDRAWLCLDCDSIGNCSRQCPSCASEALMSVSSALDRSEQKTTMEMVGKESWTQTLTQ